ncbi:hypothetical protein [Sporolactobacillus putidus]|uniref:Uncharacterized protein n=1 Tax=Sporolactobacillus putidus TaxID=492735 RepID=A0A917S038_9BACL|nr:hypothetical protein [Sporolactobacillus putidus]GGL48096.1 hypothetical protein GCM10007968_10390 [Sporolactobacillus putidus]
MTVSSRLLQISILTGLVLVSCLSISNEVTAQPFPTKIIVTERNPDFRSLVATSDLIVYAHLDVRINKWETGRTLPPNRRLVNSRQEIHILNTYRGTAPSPAYLLTTGVEPLPRPDDPMNALYTGPLADGDYVLFLKEYGDKRYYTLNGGFSAVYPVYGGKIIALYEGFKELDGQSLEELKSTIRR